MRASPTLAVHSLVVSPSMWGPPATGLNTSGGRVVAQLKKRGLGVGERVLKDMLSSFGANGKPYRGLHSLTY